jgi:hypothetical protein
MKTAEEKVSSVSKDEWAAPSMHTKETEEYQKMKPAIDGILTLYS